MVMFSGVFGVNSLKRNNYLNRQPAGKIERQADDGDEHATAANDNN